ncbi:hypothetical protein CEXT_231451, partial [Caerostris extrusa]
MVPRGCVRIFPKSLPSLGAVYTLLSPTAFRVIGKGERTLEDKVSVGTLYKAEESSTRVYAEFRILPFCLELPNAGDTADTLQQVAPNGRRILSVDNATSSGDGGGLLVPSCIPPSLDEFPDDFFTQEQRMRGGLIVHALIIAYICLMLAIVCDKYFVPCLKVMASYFKVPTDIAGATFMAIGASSPELFSSVIGAFVTEGDIGVGTVVGSAVFNILAVTGAAGFAVGSSAVQLDQYPITRDCAMYIVTISTLVVIIHDNVVT